MERTSELSELINSADQLILSEERCKSEFVRRFNWPYSNIDLHQSGLLDDFGVSTGRVSTCGGFGSLQGQRPTGVTQKILGPKANPYLSSVFAINDGSNKGPTRTNKLVPSRATSSETLNSLAVAKVAVLKTELEKVMQRVMDDKTRV
jgi:hypothetical protein